MRIYIYIYTNGNITTGLKKSNWKDPKLLMDALAKIKQVFKEELHNFLQSDHRDFNVLITPLLSKFSALNAPALYYLNFRLNLSHKNNSIMSNRRNLNLNPLSIVKFFYERLGEKAIEQPFIHPALYLVYQKIQKKESIVLFREKFVNAETTPVLPSVYNYLEKKNKLTFRQIPDITDETIAYYLENVCRRYQRKYENEELELFTCDLQFRAQKLAGNI